jgi:DNA-binding transcriptional LysR family regulator
MDLLRPAALAALLPSLRGCRHDVIVPMSGPSTKIGTRRPARGTISGPKPKLLDDLAVFVAVARAGSFVRASGRTGVPTSSVSRAVARLEEELGACLLRRTSRKVALTDEGRRLLARTGPLIDGLGEALASSAGAAGEPSGLVRITAPAFTGATRIAASLAELARAHPLIDVELDASNALRDLVEDGFDFGVRVGPAVDADFVARRLSTGTFSIFATRELLRSTFGRKRPLATRETFERGPCVVMRTSAVWRFRDAAGRRVEVKPRARFAINDPRAAVEVASRGVGFVLAPREAAAAAPSLVPVACDLGEPEPIELYIVYPSRRLLSDRARLVMEWLLRSSPP